MGSQVEQMTASVELIEALGGGWDNSQLPTPAVTQTPGQGGYEDRAVTRPSMPGTPLSAAWMAMPRFCRLRGNSCFLIAQLRLC